MGLLTVYKEGNWQVVFEDSTDIIITVGDEDYFMTIVDGDTKRILFHNSVINFNKNIVEIKQL